MALAALDVIRRARAIDPSKNKLAAGLSKDLPGYSMGISQPKRALIEIDGLSVYEAHGLQLFKNEGLAPDAAQRIEKFQVKRRES